MPEAGGMPRLAPVPLGGSPQARHASLGRTGCATAGVPGSNPYDERVYGAAATTRTTLLIVDSF